ncbi:hypothetical protein KJ840_05595 [Patescibacteria group bacterium]|nr:hypothetical protein [Patescibacteria group bacterium]
MDPLTLVVIGAGLAAIKWLDNKWRAIDSQEEKKSNEVITPKVNTFSWGDDMNSIIPYRGTGWLDDNYRLPYVAPNPIVDLATLSRSEGWFGNLDFGKLPMLSNELAKQAVTHEMQGSVPHLTHLAEVALATDPTCREVVVTDTIFGGTPCTGLFGRSGFKNPVEFTRTIRVKKF